MHLPGLFTQPDKLIYLNTSTPAVKGRQELRLSPHVYNSALDLDRAVEILKHL